MVTNRIFVAASLFSFALFPFAARADVHVSTWAELKDAVENGDGSMIYLDGNITADLNSPITTYVAGTVIDGQGFKLVGPEQTGNTKVNANFFNFTTDFSKDFTEEQRLKIQSLNFENGFAFNNRISSSYKSSNGGAIYNSGGMIGDVIGDFTNNYAADAGSAVYNDRGKIGNIIGDFSGSGVSFIHNRYGTIKSINGNFTCNISSRAIVNERGSIGDIKGKFKNISHNTASVTSGGAIYNWGDIKDIEGYFADNYVQSVTISVFGGAIFNNESATIGDVNGDFTNNYAKSETSVVSGGAIYNGGKIKNINGDYSKNYAQSKTEGASGGAIYNNIYNSIGSIKGNFSDNYAQSETSSADGGAIYNKWKIKDITGNFSNNYTSGESAHGGAIYSYNQGISSSHSMIEKIAGDFIGNHAQGAKGAMGGAVYNVGIIQDIHGNFTNNYLLSETGNVFGGAIFNQRIINDIDGNFLKNYIKSNGKNIAGGAIFNYFQENIGKITGNFIENYVQTETSYAKGGAIWNQGIIKEIEGDFTGNYVQSDEGFSSGGAIDNRKRIEKITGNFINNFVSGKEAYGGAIAQSSDNNIIGLGDIIGNFVNNFASSKVFARGGAIYNTRGEIEKITGTFANNYVLGQYALGGAIYNDKPGKISLVNSSFYNNYAQTGTTDINNAKGGAIWHTGDGLTITADNGKSEFSGNKIIYKDEKGSDIEKSNAIHLETHCVAIDGKHHYSYPTLNLNSINNGLIKFDDGIRASDLEGSQIFITGDASSRVEFNEQIENVGSIDVSGTNVDVNKGVFYRSVTHDGGVLNINSAAEDTVVNNEGLVNIASGASTKRNAVNDGGKMIVHAGGLAEDTTVNSGGSLSVEAAGRLHNMLANSGAILDMESGAVLSGNITIHAGAQMGGSYDYSKIFEDDDKDNGSLTLIGGLNDAMQENSLITSTEAKKLNLADGFFALGDGTQSVRGWDSLNVKDNATLKVEGHMALADASKNINLLNGSTMDLAGHSPSNYTIIGSLNNDGHVTFSHEDDEADDITTIYGNYKAFANAELTIDVNPAANLADKLVIEGDVEGSTKVVLNALTEDKPSSKIVFVEAPNDNLDTGAYFDIYRVMGNPYKWNSLYEDNKWYVGTDDLIADGSESGYGDKEDKGDLADETQGDAVLPPNFPAVPDLDADKKQDANKGTKPSVVAEVIAYGGLANAGIEQTRTLFANVRNNISGDKVYNTVCGGSYACGYDNEALKRVWASPVYSTSKVKAPYKYDADITGLDAGFDIQSDVYNRLGVFASYRKGEYDFKGDSDYFVSKTGSEIDIDSYLGGLYYRYDRGMGHVTAMVYGGIEEADIKTDDGVSAKTDGYVYGAAVEVGRGYAITKDTILEPGVAVSYTGLKYDDIHDRYGKSAKYDDVSNLEAELYLKAEKNIKLDNGIGKLYLKPAIVHNMGEGKVAITGLDTVDSLKDMTYVRIEAGGSMELTNGWSLYAMIAQAFGKDYQATSVNLGIGYYW